MQLSFNFGSDKMVRGPNPGPHIFQTNPLTYLKLIFFDNLHAYCWPIFFQSNILVTFQYMQKLTPLPALFCTRKKSRQFDEKGLFCILFSEAIFQDRSLKFGSLGYFFLLNPLHSSIWTYLVQVKSNKSAKVTKTWKILINSHWIAGRLGDQ